MYIIFYLFGVDIKSEGKIIFRRLSRFKLYMGAPHEMKMNIDSAGNNKHLKQHLTTTNFNN
jgi:hypothetical protein